jgi:hypothetical protein
MDGGEKLFAICFGFVAVVALCFIGWGIEGSMNTHNFEKHCLDVGKSIQWRTLEGQDYAVRECR